MSHCVAIEPVERDCICPTRAPDSPHIEECDRRFRAKFFGAWGAERFMFYGQLSGLPRTNASRRKEPSSE